MRIYIHREGQEEAEALESPGEATIAEELALEEGEPVLLENQDEPLDTTQSFEPAGVDDRAHVFRGRRHPIEVSVEYNGETHEHQFGASTRVQRVFKWAVSEHAFDLGEADAADTRSRWPTKRCPPATCTSDRSIRPPPDMSASCSSRSTGTRAEHVRAARDEPAGAPVPRRRHRLRVRGRCRPWLLAPRMRRLALRRDRGQSGAAAGQPGLGCASLPALGVPGGAQRTALGHRAPEHAQPGLWPGGSARILGAFRPEWRPDALYMPMDGLALEAHPDGGLYARDAWDPGKDITQYLRAVRELITQDGYSGVRAPA